MNELVAPVPRRRRTLLVATLSLALLGGLLALTVPRADAHAGPVVSDHHSGMHAGHRVTPAELALHDGMRKLWEDHVTWTRLAIVTFADRSKGFDATAARLLQNQVDIGNAIKPYYGAAAGDRLTALLHDHITIAVEVLQAARAGDKAAFAQARSRWYANADQIADFLARANPRYWPDRVMRADMRTHLDQTLAEAAHELAGSYAAGVTDYEAVHAHILAMADMLTDGIVCQFPSRFR